MIQDARLKSRCRVISLGTATTRMPARTPASIPFCESSKMTVSSGCRERWWSAMMNKSGAGLTCLTVPQVNMQSKYCFSSSRSRCLFTHLESELDAIASRKLNWRHDCKNSLTPGRGPVWSMIWLEISSARWCNAWRSKFLRIRDRRCSAGSKA